MNTRMVVLREGILDSHKRPGCEAMDGSSELAGTVALEDSAVRIDAPQAAGAVDDP